MEKKMENEMERLRVGLKRMHVNSHSLICL